MSQPLDGDFGGTFPYEAHFVRAGDVALHYVDEGPRDAAPTLFVHGNPTWSYMWRRPIAELSARGRRCGRGKLKPARRRSQRAGSGR